MPTSSATSAAAALFAKALPKSSDLPSNGAIPIQGVSRGQPPVRGHRTSLPLGSGRSRIASRGEDDVGMAGVGRDGIVGASRRGRQGARSGPMGDRPDGRSRGAVNLNTERDGNRRGTGSPSSSTQPSANTIDQLRLFLLSRYSAPDQMLNMENMANDPVLRKGGLLAPGQVGAPSSMAGALWKLAAELFPDVKSLSLANNALTSILPLSPYLLTSFLPGIENVSFANNSLARLRDIDPLSPSVGSARKDKKPKGWSSLRELILLGNPLVETGPREMEYRRQLDQSWIDPSIAFATVKNKPDTSDLTPGLSPAAKRESAKGKQKREPAVFPLPVADGFFESDVTRAFASDFFNKFFSAFDTDRNLLLPVYAPVCTFSFFVDTVYVLRSRAKNYGGHGDRKFPNQRKLNWKAYLGSDGSRNLQRVKNPGKRVATLKISPEAVIKSFLALPRTSHPLTDPSKFLFESYTMPEFQAPVVPGSKGETVIYFIVHGQFTELPSRGVRSFDRTFILAPAPSSSPAEQAGWQCIILSDVLVVRGYSEPTDWPKTESSEPKVLPASSITPAALSVAPPERADGITDEQQALILQLQSVTKLTYTFAHMCLVGNSWNPATALGNFNDLLGSGTIPAEAFLP